VILKLQNTNSRFNLTIPSGEQSNPDTIRPTQKHFMLKLV